MATGGPDAFGYNWDDTVPYSWIDLTAIGVDTGLGGATQVVGPIALPFSFKFYENAYSQIYISKYGYVGFSPAGLDDDQGEVPNPTIPNGIIAPYWVPLYVNEAGSGYTGRVYRHSGGTYPNRYFAVEWYNVYNSYDANVTYTFEVLLYENGTIMFQYNTTSSPIIPYYCGQSGIEDSTGLVGLNYIPFCALPPSSVAVQFTRPAPAARVFAFPSNPSGFTTAGTTQSYQIGIRNLGDFGTDTFNLVPSSSWPLGLYAADGVTPIANTGPVPQGSTLTITVKVQTPGMATQGDYNAGTVQVRSSLNSSVSQLVTVQNAISSAFAQGFLDWADGANAVYLAQPASQMARKATADRNWGNSAAIAELPDGGFIYLWYSSRTVTSGVTVREVKYTILDPNGLALRPITRLTDHTGATISTYDYEPVVAAAPNGSVGIAFYRYLYNSSTGQFNYNIFFAVLDSAGIVLYAPSNITNNSIWGASADLNVPRVFSPRITAAGDSRFVLSWVRNYQATDGWVDDIYYGVEDSNGLQIKAPTALTSDTPGSSVYTQPALAALSSNRVFVSWEDRGHDNTNSIRYVILDSSGNLNRTTTMLSDSGVVNWQNWDAVQLANGRIFAVWEGYGCPGGWASRLRYAILDMSYNRVYGPACLGLAPSATNGDSYASVAADAHNNVIITWTDWGTGRHLYYALVKSDGTIVTPPMSFRQSQAASSEVVVSTIGYGATSFAHGFIYRAYLPLVLRDAVIYYEGPWETEPNNAYLQANGPIRSGRDYYGYPNDARDYWSFFAASPGNMQVDLTNHTGQGVQLQLFYQSPAGGPVAIVTSAPYHLDYNGTTGWYYVYIYTAGGYNQVTPYTLRVSYPF
jgi:hypothetical protein